MTELETGQAHRCRTAGQERSSTQGLLAAQTGGNFAHEILGFTWVGRGEFYIVERTLIRIFLGWICDGWLTAARPISNSRSKSTLPQNQWVPQPVAHFAKAGLGKQSGTHEKRLGTAQSYSR